MPVCAVTGTLDAWLPSLTALQFIDVSLNALSGSIPLLSGMSSLRSFSASLNQLSGTLPADWLRYVLTLLLSCSTRHALKLRVNLDIWLQLH